MTWQDLREYLTAHCYWTEVSVSKFCMLLVPPSGCAPMRLNPDAVKMAGRIGAYDYSQLEVLLVKSATLPVDELPLLLASMPTADDYNGPIMEATRDIAAHRLQL